MSPLFSRKAGKILVINVRLRISIVIVFLNVVVVIVVSFLQQSLIVGWINLIDINVIDVPISVFVIQRVLIVIYLTI